MPISQALCPSFSLLPPCLAQPPVTTVALPVPQPGMVLPQTVFRELLRNEAPCSLPPFPITLALHSSCHCLLFASIPQMKLHEWALYSTISTSWHLTVFIWGPENKAPKPFVPLSKKNPYRFKIEKGKMWGPGEWLVTMWRFPASPGGGLPATWTSALHLHPRNGASPTGCYTLPPYPHQFMGPQLYTLGQLSRAHGLFLKQLPSKLHNIFQIPDNCK